MLYNSHFCIYINTFSELIHTFFAIHPASAIVGLFSIAVLVLWDKLPFFKSSKIPASLIVIVLGMLLSSILARFGVQVPVRSSLNDSFLKASLGFLTFPDFSILSSSKAYIAGITIALVASLETLLNLEAIEKLDTLERPSDPNRELFVSMRRIQEWQ